MASSRVDHKDETDGKRNLDCAGKGLFITHSSCRTAGGPPERRNHRATRLLWSPGFVLLLYRAVFGSGKRWCFPVARVRMLITALKIKNFYVYMGGFSLVKAAQHFLISWGLWASLRNGNELNLRRSILGLVNTVLCPHNGFLCSLWLFFLKEGFRESAWKVEEVLWP